MALDKAIPIERGPVDCLLRPRSIAIVGASGDPAKLGAMPLQFLQRFGFQGRIYPINPGYQEMFGLRCYPSPAALPEDIDLLVVTVAWNRVPGVLQDCAPGRVRSALVLTSGYGETGDVGASRERELKALAAERGIRFCGPNSVGCANLWDGAVPSISQVFDAPGLRPGPVAFVTQSGALGTAIVALANAAGVGVGYFVSSGNEADLDFTDYGEYFLDDPRVRVIAGYVEGVRDGRRFLRFAERALARGKPVLLTKVGASASGGQAARSHTGALTGSEEVYRAAFAQAGVVRAESLEQLIDHLQVFTAVQQPVGDRVAIVSHSGGIGVLMSDACEANGMRLPQPPPALAARLRGLLPEYATLRNPLDMTANVVLQPDTMVGCLEAVLADEAYDAALLAVNLIWRKADALAEGLKRLKGSQAKPFLVSWMGAPEGVAPSLGRAGVATFADPTRCVRAAAARIAWERARRRAESAPARPRAHAVRVPAASEPSGRGSFSDRMRLLEGAGIPLAPWRLVTSEAGAVEAAEAVGYPVALKVISPAVAHKSDVGGVATSIGDPQGLARAYLRMSSAFPEATGFLVQRMIHGGLEAFVGSKRDPTFGPVLLAGLGGIYVEALREIDMWLAPLDRQRALDVLSRSRLAPFLTGIRGQAPRDAEALAALLERVSDLMEDHGVESLDLNPVMVMERGSGVWVADARVLFPGEDAAAGAAEG
jgi:acyl-CoA synthetase (NDP forming)